MFPAHGSTGRRRRRVAGLGAVACTALVLAGCGGSDDAEGGDNTLTWWHNQNTEPGKGFWRQIADEYEADHPEVKIEVVALQNEEFRTKIPVALQSPNPPDIFQQWGGGQMAEQVEAGKLRDISADVAPWIGDLGATVSGWQLGDKTYGIPHTLGIVGFWYNKDHFARAGITTPPATWDDLIAAVGKLKAAGLTPIALGAKDKWPDAFYWDYLALRICTQEEMEKATTNVKLEDPCWTKAGQEMQRLIDVQPFQKGFLGTPAQQGAGSSAGLIGNGKAAMELMGHWNPNVMNQLTPDQKGIGDKLGWFPFPAVPGGAGAPDAALGGGDGFSCSYKAPPACTDFLKYLLTTDVQTRWAKLGIGLPTNKNATGAVTDPNLKGLLEVRDRSSFVQNYLDIEFGQTVGQALNDAVALQFAGTADPQQVVQLINDAAANR